MLFFGVSVGRLCVLTEASARSDAQDLGMLTLFLKTAIAGHIHKGGDTLIRWPS